MNIKWRGTVDAAHFIPGHVKCGRLHGHTYEVTVECSGPTPDGHPKYLLDYGLIKDAVHTLDHRIILPEHHPDITLKHRNSKLHVTAPGMELFIPSDNACVIAAPESSAECIAEVLANAIYHAAEDRLDHVRVSVKETPNTEATHYAPQ